MKSLPVISLVMVNLIPLVGVLLLGWDVATIMVLYWAENIVIGIFNVLRMMSARAGRTEAKPSAGSITRAGLILFFLVHYGIFTAGHGVFVMVIFGGLPGNLAHLVVPFLSLVFSHSVSFFRNYLGRGEYQAVSIRQLFFQPYRRVIVMHITIIIGGMLSMFLGSPPLMLAVLIILKLGTDLNAHRREHRELARLRAGSSRL